MIQTTAGKKTIIYFAKRNDGLLFRNASIDGDLNISAFIANIMMLNSLLSVNHSLDAKSPFKRQAQMVQYVPLNQTLEMIQDECWHVS